MKTVLPLHQAGSASTLTDTALERLREDIVSGARPPGERLRIERLREHYGIGSTPLREALQRLSAEGLVLALNNRGFTVAPLDPDEFADLTRARIAVERECLSLSIANGDRDWEAAVVSASYLMGRADSEEEPGTEAWEAANAAFHHAMVVACGSVWLLRVRGTLQTLAERYRRASVGRSRGRRDLGAEHRAISQAVLSRKTDLAQRLTAEHYAKTEEELRAAGP